MAERAKWYVVHTYSGYENAVATAIMKAAENRKMTDLILEVSIPMETVTEHTDSGEKTVERKVFPGYVLVKMILTDDSWHLIHNVRGATGFVGSDGKAVPLTEEHSGAGCGTSRSGGHQLRSWRYRPGYRRSSGRLQRNRGRSVPGKRSGPCYGLDVWQRDPGRSGT